MQLAKKQIDVGLYTNETAGMIEFWQTNVGLPFQEILPLGQGVRQHRYGLNGSVLKLNSVRDPLPPAKQSGYRELLIASPDVVETETLWDMDGNAIRLVLPGYLTVNGVALKLAVSNTARFHDFYGNVMQLQPAAKNTYRIGDSLVMFEEQKRVAQDQPLQAKGFRYFTIQVVDIDREHAKLVERGAVEGMAPVTLAATARISFIRDPDGNWIELSQRASLTSADD
jgi:predicted enzyme related to lactoylglutathione lyase